mgnify:CR=1 FL=1
MATTSLTRLCVECLKNMLLSMAILDGPQRGSNSETETVCIDIDTYHACLKYVGDHDPARTYMQQEPGIRKTHGRKRP